MLRTVVAYLITLALAPSFAALLNLVFIPVAVAFVPKGTDPRSGGRVAVYGILRGLFSVAEGFAAVWFARLIFGWLHVNPTVWIAWSLGASFALNDFRMLRASVGSRLLFPRLAEMVGDLGGIVLGAAYLL
jgi:hypothetical protein